MAPGHFRTRSAQTPNPTSSPSAHPTLGTDTTKASEFSTATMPMHGLYRWHLPDPVYFQDTLRVPVQQIGTWDHGLFERSDDISTTAYWFQTTINDAFSPLPSAQHRTPR